uniref:Uncharacterized protein n=1 Tax=Anguilla anguilla TaxID=7936 RepID=A0A0E9XH48_ANGAN
MCGNQLIRLTRRERENVMDFFCMFA